VSDPSTPTEPSALFDLIAFLDRSPSPYHVVRSAGARLEQAGFTSVAETASWDDVERGYVARGGALIAWAVPDGCAADAPFRLVGAHTDSPGLRIKPNPDTGAFGWRQLAVEVYGGVLLNSWLDRDLGVAGRVVAADGEVHLVALDEPIARIPQLAIHLDRDVNERGLVLDKQQHLSPVWGTGTQAGDSFAGFVSTCTGTPASAVASWDLQLYDVTGAAVIGADRSLLASGRLDNQVSCWAAVTALSRVSSAAGSSGRVAVIALFDHEEVGSESDTGAAGPLLERVLERIVLSRRGDRDAYLRALGASTCISADNAHAVHPNYPERHEPGHRPIVNHGPALKINANQRYATSSLTAALFARCCNESGTPMQHFVSRNNMPCGSTIGPITATRLGIATADVGVPQLSMHSARELCGTDDPQHLVTALTHYLAW
jgi:aspartyl aminopeptidase